VAIDIFGSLRSTVLISLVAASFTAPVVVQGDALDGVVGRLSAGSGGKSAPAEPRELMYAGGLQFALPTSWGRLGAGAAAGGAGGADRIGTVVSALCPGGTSAGACAGDARLTFVAYSGDEGRELPSLTKLEGRLDEQFAREHAGFERSESRIRPGADGTRYLDYRFTWLRGGQRVPQRLAAYRHEDGSGVVVVAAGSQLAGHDTAIDAFLATAQEPQGVAH
jgi:hypothetical protein